MLQHSATNGTSESQLFVPRRTHAKLRGNIFAPLSHYNALFVVISDAESPQTPDRCRLPNTSGGYAQLFDTSG